MTMQLELPDLETFGWQFGWRQGSGDWAGVQAAIAAHQPIQVIQEVGSTEWQAQLPHDHPFIFDDLSGTDRGSNAKARLWISPMQRRFAIGSRFPKGQWHPRVLWVGIGCQQGTPQVVIAQAVQEVFQAYHLAVGAIAGIGTIDRKANEAGLVAFCRDRALPLRCFAATQLQSVPVPTPATLVNLQVDTPSVAEAAALLAAQSVALTPPTLRLAKKIWHLPGQPSVTIAIAQADREVTDSVH